uniref:Na+/H+ antiporter NhaA n=1 Tax=Paractinoplanes polyasparticus TaxID=2856853 RepID=UPI0034DB41B1
MLALIWANLPGGSYETLWHSEFTVGLGDARITEDLRHWINRIPQRTSKLPHRRSTTNAEGAQPPRQRLNRSPPRAVPRVRYPPRRR